MTIHLITVVTWEIDSLEDCIIIQTLGMHYGILHEYTPSVSPLLQYTEIRIWPFLCDCTVGTVGILACCDGYFYVLSVFVHNCLKIMSLIILCCLYYDGTVDENYFLFVFVHNMFH